VKHDDDAAGTSLMNLRRHFLSAGSGPANRQTPGEAWCRPWIHVGALEYAFAPETTNPRAPTSDGG
jgi:hypothetical protein